MPTRFRLFGDNGPAHPRGPGIVYEPCPISSERAVNVCRSCGGAMETEPVSRVTYCPRCTLPPPPEIYLDVDVWEPGQLEALPWWLTER